MHSDQRRAPRYNDFIPVVVTLNNGTTALEAGPFKGRVVNISLSGACLLMPHGATDIFQALCNTSQNPSAFLEIRENIATESERFKLMARPVWTTSVLLDDLHAFTVGIEFLRQSNSEQIATIIESIVTK